MSCQHSEELLQWPADQLDAITKAIGAGFVLNFAFLHGFPCAVCQRAIADDELVGRATWLSEWGHVVPIVICAQCAEAERAKPRPLADVGMRIDLLLAPAGGSA